MASSSASTSSRVAAKRLERAQQRADSTPTADELRRQRVLRERAQEREKEAQKEEQELEAECNRALDDVKSDARSLIMGYASRFKSDRRFILAACRLNGDALKYAPVKYCSDFEIVLAAVRRNGAVLEHVLGYAPAAIRQDRRIILAAVAHYGVLATIPDDFKADKEIVWAAVSRHGGTSIRHAAPSLRSDREFMLEAVSHGGGDPLRYASEALQADRDFVLHCVRANPSNVQWASDELRDDFEVMMTSLRVADGERTNFGTGKERSNGGTFEFASARLRSDPAFVIAALRLIKLDEADEERCALDTAVANATMSIQLGRLNAMCQESNVPCEVWLQREVVLAAIDVMYGTTWPFLLPLEDVFVEDLFDAIEMETLRTGQAQLRADRDVMMAAVQHDGTALRYAAGALQDDRDLVSVAVAQNGSALQYASAALRDDEEIVRSALATPPRELDWRHIAGVWDVSNARKHPYQFASLRVRALKPMALSAMERQGMMLQYAAPELQEDKEVVLAAVTQCGDALSFAADALCADREIVLSAVRTAGDVLQFASVDLKADAEVVLTAVSQNGTALEDASDALAGQADIVLAAVRNNPLVLKFAMEEVQAVFEVAEVAVRGSLAALPFVAPALREDRRILHAMVDGYLSRKHANEEAVTRDRGVRDLKEHISQLPSLKAKLHATGFWQEVGERLIREESEQLKRDREKAEAFQNLREEEPGYISPAEVAQIKRDYFECRLARSRGGYQYGAEDDAATDEQHSGEGLFETYCQGATAQDELLLKALQAYDETPQVEGVAAADVVEDAQVTGEPAAMIIEATVVSTSESDSWAASNTSWSELTSFRPASLQLSELPQATNQLTRLTLLWANDNQLSTLPALPPTLTELYLQRNSFIELPAAVISGLPQLRSIWLHENKLASLPESLGSLNDLRDLIAFRNRIARLPDSLCTLSSLRELRLDENELTAVPAAIGGLVRLQRLDLSKNRLVALPRSIGDLQSLCSLRIWFNRLSTFPAEIGKLRELEELSASQNEIVALPSSFGALSDSLIVNLLDNPLQKPPRVIAERGVAAIRSYFTELARSESVVSRFAKLVLVGDGEVGKTSLLRLLQWRRAAPTAAEERTVQLDMSMLGVKSSKAAAADENGKEAWAALFSCWDLSGQPEYASAQQPFIASGPLFLLAVPAHRCRDDEYAAVLGRWLDVLQASAPGAVVQIVVTQADRLLSPAQLAAAVEHHELRTTRQCIVGVPSAVACEGRLYFECTVHSKGSSCCVGWATGEFNAPDAPHESLGNLASSWCLNLANGKLRHGRREHHVKNQLANTRTSQNLMEYADGDVLGLAVDFAIGEFWLARNDEWFVAFTVDPLALEEAGGLYPCVEGIGCVLTLNCGATPFTHAPPDSRYYAPWAPTVPTGHCEQLRGTPEAFALTPLWRAEALQDAAAPAVEWVRHRVAEHRLSYERRCAGLATPSSAPRPLHVQPVIPVCSALPGGEATGDAVRSQLEAISCASPPLLPSIGFTIPTGWLLPMAFVRAIRDGISPTYAVRRAMLGLEPLDPRTDGDPRKRKAYERVTTLRSLWEAVGPAALSAATPRGGNAYAATEGGGSTVMTEGVDAQSVDDALMLLAAQGETFMCAGIAYLDPSFVATLMKPLVDHRLSSRAGALSIAQSAAHGSALMSALDELTTAGVLRADLLAFLWRDTGLEAADYAAVLRLLEETGIIFPIEETGIIFPITATASLTAETAASDRAQGYGGMNGGGRWVMPMRLPTQPPGGGLPGSWNQSLFYAREGEDVRAEVLSLGSFVPPGLLERLMAACYVLGHHHHFWRRPQGAGALIKVALASESQSGSAGEARLLFDVDEGVSDGETPEADAHAVETLYALRFEVFAPQANVAEGERLLAKAKALLERLLLDFPGMITSALRGAAEWKSVRPRVPA